MVMMHGQIIFIIILYGKRCMDTRIFRCIYWEVIWRIDLIVKNEVICLMRLSMYRPSEIILPEGTVLPQDIKDFMDN